MGAGVHLGPDVFTVGDQCGSVKDGLSLCYIYLKEYQKLETRERVLGGRMSGPSLVL